MESYGSAQAYAIFQGKRIEPYRFTCWRDANSDELHVLVMEFRIRQEPTLEWVRSEGIDVDGGYMVPRRAWDARVTRAEEPL
jgi:hypothetical protein